MVVMNKRHIHKTVDNQEGPRKESDKRTGVIRSCDISKRTIVRNNRAGTIGDVYDHYSTTHVDCVSSSEGSMEPLKITNEIEDDYPWYFARNIKKWIEAEMQQPDISWPIDNYDGAASFEVLGLQPLPKDQAGTNMGPSEVRELRNKLTIVEEELDELVDRKDLDEKAKNQQRKQLVTIAISLCDDFENTGTVLEETMTRHSEHTQKWRHGGQAYCVRACSTTELEISQDVRKRFKKPKLVNCVLRGTSKR